MGRLTIRNALFLALVALGGLLTMYLFPSTDKGDPPTPKASIPAMSYFEENPTPITFGPKDTLKPGAYEFICVNSKGEWGSQRMLIISERPMLAKHAMEQIPDTLRCEALYHPFKKGESK